jgi:hypothetical protein
MVTKMFPFELALGKEAKKLMDLVIPMGWRNHSKETVGTIKGCEEKYAWAKKLLNRFKNGMRNMPTKHEGMWSLRLSNMCG